MSPAEESGPSSIPHAEGRTVFGPALPAVVEPRGRNVRMAEPLLDLGDVGLMFKRVGGGGRAQGVHADPVDRGVEPGRPAIVPDDVPIDRRGVEWTTEGAGPVVLDRPEERPVAIVGVSGQLEVVLDEPLGHRVGRDKPDLVPLAVQPEVLDALPAFEIAHAQPAEFFTAHPVIEQRGEDGAVPEPFERAGVRGLEEHPRLCVAQRRRRSFIGGRAWTFDAINWVAGDGIALTQILEQRRQRRELPPDGRPGQLAGLEAFPPGDDMCPGEGPDLSRMLEAGKAEELADVGLVGAPGFGIGEVGEPLEFGRDGGEGAELGDAQRLLISRRGDRSAPPYQ